MTLDYGSVPAPTATRHDHVYTTLLGVLAFFVLIGMVTLLGLREQPTTSPESKAAFLMPLAVEGCFLAAMAIVLLIRIVFPANRKWPTLGLNIVLLFFIPVGTALAVYGLIKVDKKIA